MISQLHSSLGFASRPGESLNPRFWDRLRLSAPPCLGFAGRNLPDLSPARFDLAITGTAYSIGMSPIGPCLTFTGNAAMQQNAASWGLPCKFCINDYYDAIFLQAYFKFTHSAGAKESTLFWSDNPTVGSSQYGYRLYVDNNADKLKLMIANGDLVPAATPTVYTSAGTLASGRWYHVIVGWWPLAYDTGGGPSDACRMWIDGRQDGLPAVTNSTPSGVEEFCSHLATQNARIGATLGSTSPDFSIALLNVWNRGLADAEIAQLSVDPLAMFRRAEVSGAGKAPRRVSLGGATLRRMNIVLTG